MALATVATPKVLLVAAAFAPSLGLLVPFVAPFFDELVGIILLFAAARLFSTGDMVNLVLA
jgi:hypothetical protein